MDPSYVNYAKYIGAGLACIAPAGAGIGVGIIAGNYISGSFRNPQVAPAQRAMFFVGVALSEVLGLLGFVIALIMLFS